MKYIGCDFHPSFQQIAMLDKQTGELVEHRLLHTEQARVFYEGLEGPVVVGIEASGNTHWFESLLARCRHELWIGDAAEIARQDGRKQKNDRRSANLILKLMVEDRFPRIWVPTAAERDLRQLLVREDSASGPGGGPGIPSPRRCAAPGYPPRSGTGDFSGHGADHGGGGAV
jgi:transposase